MVYGCGNKCVKFCVFLFNFLAFLVGLAVLIFGIVGLTSNEATKFILQSVNNADFGASLRTILILACVVGSIIMVIGFFGCCGACLENRCLLGCFVVLMLILAAAQLALGILALTQSDTFKSGLDKALGTTVTNECKASCPKDFCDTWKTMEKNVKCCGLKNYVEANFKLTGCRDNTPCPMNATDCSDGLFNEMQSYAKYVGGAAIGLVVLEIFAAIFSVILCCGISHGYHSV